MGNNKRKRTENWTQQDKQILQHLVKKYVQIIENKNTDTNTNKKKIQAWNEIMNSFNELCLGSKRSASQLKAQWSSIKLITKQRQAEAREYYTKTGAGDAPPLKIPKTEDVEINEINAPHLQIQIQDCEPEPLDIDIQPAELTAIKSNEIGESPLLCRKDLHTAQMELVLLQLNNERKRSKLLDLEENVLKAKLKYYDRQK